MRFNGGGREEFKGGFKLFGSDQHVGTSWHPKNLGSSALQRETSLCYISAVSGSNKMRKMSKSGSDVIADRDALNVTS